MGTLTLFGKRGRSVKIWKFAWEIRQEVGTEDQKKRRRILRKLMSYVGGYWTQIQEDIWNWSEDMLV